MWEAIWWPRECMRLMMVGQEVVELSMAPLELLIPVRKKVAFAEKRDRRVRRESV